MKTKAKRDHQKGGKVQGGGGVRTFYNKENWQVVMIPEEKMKRRISGRDEMVNVQKKGGMVFRGPL